MTAVSEFCTSHRIEWRFIPERTPHFSGLWEAAVRSTKRHLRRIVGDVCFTFEELTTVLTQIEACLNSRPMVPFDLPDDDEVEVLTTGHFLIGRPICALPDPASSFRPITMLRRWDLCQNLVRHFWKRWSSEYLTSLNKFTKWHYPTKLGILSFSRMTAWYLPNGHLFESQEKMVWSVATVRTTKGLPVNKLALLLASD